MGQLWTLNWSGFDLTSGLKATIGLIAVLLLGAITGESWIASGIIVLFAWLTTVPGSKRQRVTGIFAFGLGALVLTFLSGMLSLELVPNLVLISVVGFLGTVAIVYGLRAYMIGYVLICWMIYGPFLITGTSTSNVALAIVFGCAVMAALTSMANWFGEPQSETSENDTANDDWSFAIPFGVTVAVVLLIGTYLGWTYLETDPTLIVGGAFFVIGFDANKTWVAGIARVVGIVAGAYLGYGLGQSIDNALLLQGLSLVAVFFAFAAGGVHPGAFMFFFLVALAIGWSSLEPRVLETTANERLWGEAIGVVLAMVALGIYQILPRKEQAQKNQI